MLLQSRPTYSCDVLVVGGGGAGLRAAVAAKSRKADVLLVSKTEIGRGTNTYISKAVIAATGWGSPEDNPHAHVKDTLEGGRFLGDPSMIANVAEQVGSEIAFLKGCGVRFAMEAGKPRVFQIPGHSFPRQVSGENWFGSGIVFPLKRHAERLGVRFLHEVFVTRLLDSEGRIRGACGITPDGGFVTIQAKAVVLATGGYAQVYLNNDNARGIHGDGQALCYDLGLPLKDMEFVQFYPTAMGKRGKRILLYENVLTQPGVVLRNDRGEDIIRRNGFSDAMGVTRDRLAQMVMQEIKDGRAKDRYVVMDTEALSEAAANRLAHTLPARWWKGQKAFRVAPTAHFSMGGVVTDPNGETSLPGLFAAGEVAAGVHGANRLGGNALAEVFAMGSLVGEKAAERAMETDAPAAQEEAAKNERFRLEGTVSTQGSTPEALMHALQDLMWYNAGILRREQELREALERIQGPWPRACVAGPRDLIALLEFRNMRLVAEMVCRAALMRTETRGSHFRVDHPHEDNDAWLRNIEIRKEDAGMVLDTRPVRTGPANPESSRE